MRRKKKEDVPSAGTESQDGQRVETSPRRRNSGRKKKLVGPIELKDELVVCHRHECLRVPARSTPQLGLSVATGPPPDQRL